MIGWLDVHRAVAACIGTYISMSANNNSEWIVAAIMEARRCIACPHHWHV
jgi:hypothetical protein